MSFSIKLVGTLGAACLMALSVSAEVRMIQSSPRAEKAQQIMEQREKEISAATRGENWVGSKAVILDQATRQLRKPTASETAEMIKSLRVLTARPAGMPGMVHANGARQGSVDGLFANVVIARYTADGGVETLCTQSFDEAVNFLGLERQTTRATN